MQHVVITKLNNFATQENPMYDIGVLQRQKQTTYFRIHDLIGHCFFRALNVDRGREVANRISRNVRLIFISDI